MKNKIKFPQAATFAFFIHSIILSGCDDCSEPKKEFLKPLSAKEKTIIPTKSGETLFFKDNTGKDYYLKCLKNELQTDGYSDVGRKNQCEDSETYWDKQVAEFTGNLTSDDSVLLELETSVEGSSSYGQEWHAGCLNSNGRRYFFIKIAKVNTHRFDKQYFTGYVVENTLPSIQSYTFKERIKLDGRIYNDINFTNIPACTKNQGYGLDSVYYSTTLGLIRITTIGGKTYQGVL